MTLSAHLSAMDPSDATPDLTDRRLVERIRAGDAEAFAELFRATYPGLCLFVARHVRSSAVAEDIVQEIFLGMWQRRETLDVRQRLQAYLFSAARNRALNHIKHERVVHRWEETQLWQEPAQSPAVDDDVLVSELAAALDAAIARLPERCRAVFVLSRRRGMSYAEIAAELGIAVKTVDAQMGRAMRLIREQVGHLLT